MPPFTPPSSEKRFSVITSRTIVIEGASFSVATANPTGGAVLIYPLALCVSVCPEKLKETEKLFEMLEHRNGGRYLHDLSRMGSEYLGQCIKGI